MNRDRAVYEPGIGRAIFWLLNQVDTQVHPVRGIATPITPIWKSVVPEDSSSNELKSRFALTTRHETVSGPQRRIRIQCPV